jgi:hypothetical protein
MLIATVPVHDEDGSVGTIHIRFESRADYDGFIRDLTADMCDTSDVTLAEVPDDGRVVGDRRRVGPAPGVPDQA